MVDPVAAPAGAFADRLWAAARTRDSVVVAGLDPHLELLPGPPPPDADAAAAAVVDYFGRLIPRIASEVIAVKPQAAFFEALGPPGWRAWTTLLEVARAHELLVIADVKRGDIGSTSAAYARAHLAREGLGGPNPQRADAITVNPYLGSDGVAPMIDAAAAAGGGLFVLVKTSNPSSAELQDLILADGRPVHRAVAEQVVAWGAPHRGASGYSSVGAVVGGTHPALASELRAALTGVPLLVPGYGAQGARAADMAGWFDPGGLGAIVPASRSLAFAYRTRGGDPADAAAAEAKAMREALNAVRR